MDAYCEVRDAETRHAAAIAGIYAHHVATGTATFDTVAPSAEATLGKVQRVRAAGWPFIVAVEGCEVVGYAYATAFRDRPAYAFTCENSIYVRADRTGRGIGRRLLRELLDAAATAGFRQMVAVVGGGEPASVALHRSLGFVEAGRLTDVGRKAGRWLDTVYLQRALGAGADLPPAREPG